MTEQEIAFAIEELEKQNKNLKSRDDALAEKIDELVRRVAALEKGGNRTA